MAEIRRTGKRVKALAAVLGGGAMVALGVVGAVTGGSAPAGPSVMSAGEMTMGATVTADYTETSVQTSMATPGDKAAPPCGFKSGC